MEENKIGQAKREIEKILKEAGAPYCDVLCYKEDKEIFRYVYGENATGKEKLRMYSCSKPITSFAATVPAAIWQRFSVLWQKTRD